MTILMVEDDEYKANQIINYLKSKGHLTYLFKAFHSGLRAILENSYDVIILDMSIPTFEKTANHPTSRNRNYGGRDIMYEMKRKKKISPVIIMTQYSIFGDGKMNIQDLDENLADEFSDFYLGMIYYNSSVIEWNDKLEELLTKVREEKSC